MRKRHQRMLKGSVVLALAISFANLTVDLPGSAVPMWGNTVELGAMALAQTTSSIPLIGAIKVRKAYPENGYSYIIKQDFGTPQDKTSQPSRLQHLKTNGRKHRYQIDSEPALTQPPPTTTTASPTTTTASPTTTTASPRLRQLPVPQVVFSMSHQINPSDHSGTVSAPWRTVTATALKLAAGDTAILMDGTYEEGQILFANSGTAARPITIRAQNKWGAIVSSVSSSNPAFSIHRSYITIEDLRISVSPNNVPGQMNSANVAIRAWEDNVPHLGGNTSTGTQGFTARGAVN